MAQTSAINAILGNLVTSVTGRSSKSHPREHKLMRESATRATKAQQFVRTNQFEVEGTTNGLIEKFSVLNRDDLAEAVKERIDELSKASRSKWTPEILSLFLNLSDRPVEKSNVEALELLRPPTPPESPLTWEEIVADDPLTGDIWDEVIYSAGSSDDDVVINRSYISPTSVRRKHRLDLESEETDSPALFVPSDDAFLEEVAQSQFWRTESTSRNAIGNQRIPELQVIREVIFMLRGLPTSLFTVDEASSAIFYSADISLTDVSTSSLNDAMQSLANVGSDIICLRYWARRTQKAPLLQAFHAAVASRLRDFDKSLAGIEKDLVSPSSPTAISLISTHDTIRSLSRPLLPVVKLVGGLSTLESGFACLELLYDEICILQASGDSKSYETLGRIFFDCLKIYLRPVRRWIESGELAEQDESFFVMETSRDCAPSSLWKDRFTLRMDQNGKLFAPRFLESAGTKIQNAGKSIVFLRQLSMLDKVPASIAETSLDFDKICQSDSPLALAPFSELFGAALDDWVRSKYSPASSILCQQLFSTCKLGEYLDALEYIYFSKDGTRFRTFADELFRRMDGPQKAWNDRFLLSELARSIFCSVPGVDESRIGVRVGHVKSSERSIKALSSINIDFSLPWPVLNVIHRSSLTTYQRIFRMLLQTYRAKYLLRHDSIILRQTESTDENTRRVTFVRQRLVWFVDIILSYIIETVVQSACTEMQTQMTEAETIDRMIEVHETFVSNLQTRCLLAKNLAPIHDTIISLLDLAVSYSENQNRQLGRQRAKSRFSSKQRRRRSILDNKKDQVDDETSSDEEDVDDDYDADNETPSSRNESHDERLQKIQDQFGQLLNFTIAGLKGVSRAGGESAWEMLAERLEWGSSRVV